MLLYLLLPSLGLAGDSLLESQATVHQLENGMTVVLEPQTRTDVIALNFEFGVGARDEGDGEYGCAHLFEHLMFEGSANVPTNAFDTWLKAAGGDNNAWTSEDRTVYTMSFPSGALDLALFLESDRLGFLDSGLDQENVSNQQLVVLQERNQGYAEPGGRTWDALSRVHFPADHPYHHPVIGTVADIEGFQIDKVRSFWERHYRSQNAVLTLVGNFDPEHALERIEFWFSDVPDRGPAVERVEPPAPAGQAEAQSGVLGEETEDRTLFMLWDTAHAGHEDEAALDVAAWVLSGGRGTRLSQALLEGRPMADEADSLHYASDLSGQFGVYASSHKTPLAKLEKVMLSEVSRLAEEPPTPDEIERAKSQIRSGMHRAMERPQSRAEALSDCLRMMGQPNCMQQRWQQVEAVGSDEVAKNVQTWLGSEPTRLFVVPNSDVSKLGDVPPVELP